MDGGDQARADGRKEARTAGQVGLAAEKFYPRGRISDSSRREKWGTKDGRQEINSKTTMTANASLNADSFREGAAMMPNAKSVGWL